MAITEIASHIQLNDENSNRSLIPPHLLNIWREEIGEEIWRFNQVTGDDVPTAAARTYIQPGRDIIARGIYTAYRKMTRVLGYTLLPQWFVEDIELGFGAPVAWQQLQTTMKYVIAYGQRATTLIEAAVTIVFSESNPSALDVDDRATITVASTLSADEIQIFFTAADSGRAAADERYRIAPVDVTTDGTTITIVGHRALFVQPSIWKQPYSEVESRDINVADTSTDADFVTTVDIYRVYNDTTTPAQYLSDPITTELTDLEIYNLDSGLVLPVNNRLGLFNVRFEGSQSNKFAPRMVRVFYKAGYRENFQRIDNELGQALMRLANTQMIDFPKDVDSVIHGTYVRDTQPATVNQVNVNNQFGLLKGDLYAWNICVERAIGRGGKLTRTRVRGAL